MLTEHTLHASILTVFPEMFPGPLEFSLAGQALKKKLWSYDIVNIRNFGITKHKNVDDEAYGGGDGLIMRADVLGRAIDHALHLKPNSQIYYPSPKGKKFTQKLARIILQETLQNKNLIILCGRYEGIDERVIEEYNINEISIGDYILSGGELAALTILDCLIRLLPGVLINPNTLLSESFEENGEFLGLLECPLYTRPEIWRGKKVPNVLLSGNHKLINEWKREQSINITKLRRPDLLGFYKE